MAVASSPLVQCVKVELPSGVHCTNKDPHITMATSDGIKAVLSNHLLEHGKSQSVSQLQLSGRIGVMMSNNFPVKNLDGSQKRFDYVLCHLFKSYHCFFC